MYGYSGKILHVDLATRETRTEPKPEELYKTYIGGVSMATRLCWENIESGCDPLDPGNPICIGNGLFAGTVVPVGGKWGLASKSPLTGFIGDSLSGSWFAIPARSSSSRGTGSGSISSGSSGRRWGGLCSSFPPASSTCAANPPRRPPSARPSKRSGSILSDSNCSTMPTCPRVSPMSGVPSS